MSEQFTISSDWPAESREADQWKGITSNAFFDHNFPAPHIDCVDVERQGTA